MIRCSRFIGLLAAAIVLAGCAGMEPTGRGYCSVSRCTGVCLEQVQAFAREQLGTEAKNVYFSWSGGGGGIGGAGGGTAFFSTADCPTGEYRLAFFANARICTNTFYGRIPNFVGELDYVPKGCDGPK